MQPKTPKLLDDVRDAAAFICRSTDGKTVDDYRGDRLLRHAVERNFEREVDDHQATGDCRGAPTEYLR